MTDTSYVDPNLLLFSHNESMLEELEQVKNDIDFENLSQEWEAYIDPVTQPMPELSGGLEDAVVVVEADSTPEPGRQPSVQPAANSVPVVDGWPGSHQFRATVRTRSTVVAGRQLPYVYSSVSAKLYTDMNVAVPFSFTCQGVSDPEQYRIRAVPIYKESHHIQTPVRRCAIHRDPEDPTNSAGLEMHVVRAEHHRASYHEEAERCSVTVPLEAPEPGTDDYQVLFKFSCMNTCVGGINRRRLMLVFTLEERGSGRTVGRQAVEVKVCRCPHRDWRADEKRRGTGDQPAKQTKRRREQSPAPAQQQQQQQAVVPSVQPGQQYMVQADDLAMYQYLMEARESLLRYRRSVLAAAAQPQQKRVALSRQDTLPVKPEHQ